MATKTLPDRKNTRLSGTLGRSELVDAYRNILLSRKLDDKEVQLKRQNRIFFQISGAGHEAVLTAAAMVLKPAYDWFYPYYRDRALCLKLGVTPAEMLYEAVGAAIDPASGGRQMPSHWGHKSYNIVSASSPTGTQFLQSVGSAEATLRAKLIGISEGFKDDEVVFVTTGEGQTSEGEFWESLNTASNLKLPVVYLVEDNGYAISVPVEVNTTGGNISKLVRSFPNFFIEEVDGCDFMASHEVMSRAVAYARERKGPALVHAKVIRPYSHSLSDDETMYRPSTERDADAARDPVTVFPKWLVTEGHATEDEIRTIQEEVDAIVLAATDDALAQPQPAADTIYFGVYSPDVDPTSEQFDTEDDPKFTGNPTECAAFARIRLQAAADCKLRLSLGSDDGLLVIVNGKRSFEHDTYRGVTPGEDQTVVDLQAGENTLLLRVNNGDGGFGLSVQANVVGETAVKALP